MGNVRISLKYIGLLTGLMLGVWSFVAGLLQGLFGYVDPATFGPEQALTPLPALFLVCFLNALLILWIVYRTHLVRRGVGTLIFVIVFGVMFFMPQIETIYFKAVIQMPWAIVFSNFASGLAVGLTAALLAVRLKSEIGSLQSDKTGLSRGGSALWKLAVLAVVYAGFYFLFGYYIAWQSPQVRQFYTGAREILPFWTHMQQQVATDPELVFFQLFRGFLWALIGYVVVMNTPGATRRERVFLTGLALSVGLAFPILVPNEYMPFDVRKVHFVELLVENFLFGALIALLFWSKRGKNP